MCSAASLDTTPSYSPTGKGAADAVGVKLTEGVTECVTEVVPVTVAELVIDPVAVAEGVREMVGVTLAVGEGLSEVGAVTTLVFPFPN